jgi:hypothetical protein
MAKRVRWLWLIVPAVVLLGACSRAELVYENADWLTYRWASNLVDANAEQRAVWRDRFEALLDVHREQLLPDVVSLLQRMEDEARRGLSDQQLECLLADTDQLYRDHARLAIPLAVDVLADLSPDQIDHLARELAERNSDYQEKYLSADPEERRTERVERYVKRIERWTGPLDDAQQRLVQDAIVAMPETAATWFDYRLAQQQEMLRLLRDGAGKPELQAFLTAWWVDFAGMPANLSDDALDVRRRSITLAIAVDGALDPVQRARFIDRVADIRSDLGNVMAVASGPAPAVALHCG